MDGDTNTIELILQPLPPYRLVELQPLAGTNTREGIMMSVSYESDRGDQTRCNYGFLAIIMDRLQAASGHSNKTRELLDIEIWISVVNNDIKEQSGRENIDLKQKI